MSSLEEIKSAIRKLTLSERGQLESWMHGWTLDDWDQAIVKDLKAGRLFDLLKAVDAEIDGNRLRELP
jgi:hypothetical protein